MDGFALLVKLKQHMVWVEVRLGRDRKKLDLGMVKVMMMVVVMMVMEVMVVVVVMAVVVMVQERMVVVVMVQERVTFTSALTTTLFGSAPGAEHVA